MFPVPRITESFVDAVVAAIGWKRLADVHHIEPGEPNADYLHSQDVIELKIVEEEGLEKASRQSKIAALCRELQPGVPKIDLELDRVSTSVRRELETLISEPLQTAVKKASKQIARTKQLLQLDGAGVLIGVNNGYSSLTANNFEDLLVRRCQNNSNHIDHAVCITVAYHQGSFDAFVFCTTRCRAIRGGPAWAGFDPFLTEFNHAFDRAMGRMMADQMNPELFSSSLAPVKTIRFERDSVVYERQAPAVPSSLD